MNKIHLDCNGVSLGRGAKTDQLGNTPNGKELSVEEEGRCKFGEEPSNREDIGRHQKPEKPGAASRREGIKETCRALGEEKRSSTRKRRNDAHPANSMSRPTGNASDWGERTLDDKKVHRYNRRYRDKSREGSGDLMNNLIGEGTLRSGESSFSFPGQTLKKKSKVI